MNLNNLNKDLLTKLVETISEDKQKEIDELKKLLKIYKSHLHKYKCNVEDCPAYSITNFFHLNEEATFINCESIIECPYCRNYFCNQHFITLNANTRHKFCICEECLRTRHIEYY